MTFINKPVPQKAWHWTLFMQPNPPHLPHPHIRTPKHSNSRTPKHPNNHTPKREVVDLRGLTIHSSIMFRMSTMKAHFL